VFQGCKSPQKNDLQYWRSKVLFVNIMQTPISKKKAIEVTLHGHAWKVYPMKCRNKTLCRVFHRVNGERRPKNFSSLADAKADAKNIIKEIYAQGDRKNPLGRRRKARLAGLGGNRPPDPALGQGWDRADLFA
jgi:hypothetical protein